MDDVHALDRDPAAGAVTEGAAMSKGGQAPPSKTPRLVRDVRGACGASLRACW